MKKICLMILCLSFIILMCGCGKTMKGKSFVNEYNSGGYVDKNGNKTRVYSHEEYLERKKNNDLYYESYEIRVQYNFISNSVVEYKYIKNKHTVESYKCEYSMEKDILKIKCKNETEIFSYDKKTECIIGDNDTKYCIDDE